MNTLKSAWLNEEKIPESRLAAIKCLSVLSSKIVENFLTSELETIQSDDVRQKSYDIIKSVLNKN